MKQKKVLLLGSYGQTNIGDDVLMWNYLEFLHAKGVTCVYVNASRAHLVPRIIRETYPHIRIVETYRTSLFGWMRILKQVDAVIYGGGTIYKELYAATGRSKHGVTLRMAAFNLLARFLGVPVYHLNIGIGSIKTGPGRWLAKTGIRAASYTVFRDQQSHEFAKTRLRIPAGQICQSTDGLFLNRHWEETWRTKRLDINKNQYRGVVGINALSDIPDWIDRQHYLAEVRKLARWLLKDGYFVLFIPFQRDFNPHNDARFMEKEIAPHLKKQDGWHILPRIEIDEITSVIKSCDVLVGMRFHSLLLAAAAATPFVAITYDTKCVRFVEETGYPHHITLEKFTAVKARKHIDVALHERRTLSQQLKHIAVNHYKDAEKCIGGVKF